MKKSTKTLTSSMAALASLASIVAPTSAVLAEGKTAVEVAVDAVVYAEKTVNFFDWNLAFGKVVALGDKNPQYFELLARLSKIEATVKTPEVKAVLTAMDELAANKDLTNFYNIYELASKVGNENNKNYLLNELNDWGKKAVFTPEVVAATDAVIKAWTDKTPESIAAAKVAAAKLTAKGNLDWVNAQIAEVEATLALSVKEVKATGAKILTVTFNKAVDTTKVSVSLNKGIAPVATSSITFNEDKTVATINTVVPMTAGEYTVKATGLTDAKITVEAERVASVDITTAQLQQKNTAPVVYTVKNQYGETKTMTTSDLAVSAIYAKTGATLTASVAADGKLTVDASGVTVGDNVVITITHKTTGLTKTVTVPVVAVATVAEIALGEPTMPTTVTRIAINDTSDKLMIPYTAKDQYGNAVTFAANTTAALSNGVYTIGGLNVVSSDSNIINPSTLKTDADGKLSFRTGATSGTVVLTFVAPTTGKSATLTIKVNALAAVDSFTMVQPTDFVTAKKAVTVDFIAADQFGSTYAKKDFTSTVRGTHLTFVSNNNTVVNPSTNITFNAKNELVITPQAKGVVNITVYVDGKAQNTITLDVQDEIVPTKIVGVKDLSLAAIENGVVTVKASNLKVVDQYGHDVTLAGTWTAKLALKDATETSLDLGNQTDFTPAANAEIALSNDSTTSYAQLKGLATTGSEVLVATLVNNGTAVSASAYEFSVSTIKTDAVTSYAIKEVALLKVNAAPTAVSVVGKDAAGNSVALPVGHITLLTSDSPLFTINGMTVQAVTDDGTGNISAWIGSNKVATIAVKSSDATAVPTTLEFEEDSYEITGIATSKSSVVANDLTTKDQYGVALSNDGYWTTSDAKVATVNATTGEITLVASGAVTITYIAPNGITISVPVTVVVTP